MIEKLEARVKALITDLDMEQRFKSDLVKNLRKSERRLKEVEFQFEEERKNNERFQVRFMSFWCQHIAITRA